MQAFSTNSDQALDAVLGRGSPNFADCPFYMKDHYRGVLWQMLTWLTMGVSPAGTFEKRAFKWSNLIGKVRD